MAGVVAPKVVAHAVIPAKQNSSPQTTMYSQAAQIGLREWAT